MNLDSTDYLSELRVKLGNGGVAVADLESRYKGKSVAYGLSVSEYVEMLRQDNLIDEHDNRLFFRTLEVA